MRALWPTTLLAPPLLATRPRLLRPIEPRLAARLDATVATPQPQSSPDSRPATDCSALRAAAASPPQASSALLEPSRPRGGDGGTLATGGGVRRWVQTWGSGAEPRGKMLALRVHFQAQTACGGMMWLSAKHKVKEE